MVVGSLHSGRLVGQLMAPAVTVLYQCQLCQDMPSNTSGGVYGMGFAHVAKHHQAAEDHSCPSCQQPGLGCPKVQQLRG